MSHFGFNQIVGVDSEPHVFWQSLLLAVWHKVACYVTLLILGCTPDPLQANITSKVVHVFPAFGQLLSILSVFDSLPDDVAEQLRIVLQNDFRPLQSLAPVDQILVYVEPGKEGSQVVGNHVFPAQDVVEELALRFATLEVLQPHTDLPQDFDHHSYEGTLGLDVYQSQVSVIDQQAVVETAHQDPGGVPEGLLRLQQKRPHRHLPRI